MPKLPRQPSKRKMKAADPEHPRNQLPTVAGSTASTTAAAPSTNASAVPNSISDQNYSHNENSVPDSNELMHHFSMANAFSLPAAAVPHPRPLQQNSMVSNLPAAPNAFACPWAAPPAVRLQYPVSTAAEMQPHSVAPLAVPAVNHGHARDQVAVALSAATRTAHALTEQLQAASFGVEAALQPVLEKALLSAKQVAEDLQTVARRRPSTRVPEALQGRACSERTHSHPDHETLAASQSQTVVVAGSCSGHSQITPLRPAQQYDPNSDIIPPPKLARTENLPSTYSDSASSKNSSLSLQSPHLPYPTPTPFGSAFEQKCDTSTNEDSFVQLTPLTGRPFQNT
ncbi:unnamed protein product [Gongylonema pulchrum]|uniref:Uncharacterized protein n=1 Tax=Gongylonema pulchrum TaxID=637853 RepID=A0A183ED29_9BILA|nr:unnamed protein product [Gongylonema pulchrum]